jgi:hypothetical protein
MEINKPTDIITKISNLDEFLNSKYQFKLNTENLRQELLMDIENWGIQNGDLWQWERDPNYRKSFIKELESIKLHYYTSLINQSGLNDITQRDMILKYKTNRTENEWIDYIKKLDHE